MQAKNPKSSSDKMELVGDIHILKEMYDSWEVEVFIKKTEATEDLLSRILQKVKKFLNETFAVDEQLVKYKKMTDNRKAKDGMFVSLIMEKVPISKMASDISIQSMLSEDGIPYDEMACFSNLKCEDEFGNKLSVERLLAFIKKKVSWMSILI